LIIDKDCRKFQVVIPERSMQIVLADLLNKPIETPIIFNPEMHLDSEQLIGAWWKNIQNFLQLKSQYSNFYGLQIYLKTNKNFELKPY